MAGRGGSSKRNRRPYARDKPKETPVVDESSVIIQQFLGHQRLLDARHDKYERLVKQSRDITIESKRTIFLLQRISSDGSRDKLLDEAEAKLRELDLSKWKVVAKELNGEDAHQFQRAYSPGLQEYIEAVTFHHYLKTNELLTLERVQEPLVFTLQDETKDETSSVTSHELNDESIADESSPANPSNTVTDDVTPMSVRVHVSPIDYMLGVADLTGELMRMAIKSVGSGDVATTARMCSFLRVVHEAFVNFGNVARELPRKLSVLKQSLVKVETACYTLQIRGSEFPQHMLADLISDAPDLDAYGTGMEGV